MKNKTKKIVILSLILCLVTLGSTLLFAPKIEATAQTTLISSPYVNTTYLELWDGSANVAWYISGDYDGTTKKPYKIATAKELAGFAMILGDIGYLQYDNDPSSPTYGDVSTNYAFPSSLQQTDFAGKYFVLASDIYLNTYNAFGDGDANVISAQDFTNSKNGGSPINWPYIAKDFAGHFDGQDFSILGFYSNRQASYSGLFSGLNNATVKNLTMAEGYINSNGNSTIGAIAGNIKNNNTISNCKNYVTIAQSSNAYTGGIVGAIYDWANNSIVNCTNYATINGLYGVGGIVGYASYSGNNKVLDCTNYGKIDGLERVGGIVGDSSIEIYRCTNYGDISASDSDSKAGGIVGKNYEKSVIEQCANQGTVTGQNNVGGISGYSLATDQIALINACYNTGTISGQQAVGGIAGTLDNNNYLFLVKASVKNCYNIGQVIGGERAAIVGRNTTAFTGGDDLSIVDCYFDIDTTFMSIPVATGTSGTRTLGLNTSQMLSTGTELGSGFSDEFKQAINSFGNPVWEAVDGQYPRFSGQTVVDDTKTDITTILNSSMFDIDTVYQYTGSPITPEIAGQITYSGGTLYQNQHYTVHYQHNVDAGTASIIIVGMGDYSGQLVLTFKIEKINISALVTVEINPEQSIYVYGVHFELAKHLECKYVFKLSETAVAPLLLITYPSQWGSFVEGVDYAVHYIDSDKAGTATAVVEGIGKYEGEAYVYFAISEKLDAEQSAESAAVIVSIALNLLLLILANRFQTKAIGKLFVNVNRSVELKALLFDSAEYKRYTTAVKKSARKLRLMTLAFLLLAILGGFIYLANPSSGIMLPSLAFVGAIISACLFPTKKRAPKWDANTCQICGSQKPENQTCPTCGE